MDIGLIFILLSPQVAWLLSPQEYTKPILTSSIIQDRVCADNILVFHCIANGTSLGWQVNGIGVSSYSEMTSNPFLMSQSSYSVLLSSDNGLRVSTLTILSLQSDQVSIDCFDGKVITSLSADVVVQPEQPRNLSFEMLSFSINGTIFKLTWNHTGDQFLIELEEESMTLIRNTTELVLVPNCKTRMVRVVAMDQCNNTSVEVMTRLRAECLDNSSVTSSEPASTDASSGSTTGGTVIALAILSTIFGSATIILPVVVIVILLLSKQKERKKKFVIVDPNKRPERKSFD